MSQRNRYTKPFKNTEDIQMMNKVVDLTGGFALVLAAAKAYLEQGTDLNIVAGRF